MPELAGTTTADGKRATPRFPERPEDVNVRGVSRLCCAACLAVALVAGCGAHLVDQLLPLHCCDVACLQSGMPVCMPGGCHHWPTTTCPSPALPCFLQVWSLMCLAYAAHEIVSDYTTAALMWFETGCVLLPIVPLPIVLLPASCCLPACRALTKCAAADGSSAGLHAGVVRQQPSAAAFCLLDRRPHPVPVYPAAAVPTSLRLSFCCRGGGNFWGMADSYTYGLPPRTQELLDAAAAAARALAPAPAPAAMEEPPAAAPVPGWVPTALILSAGGGLPQLRVFSLAGRLIDWPVG